MVVPSFGSGSNGSMTGVQSHSTREFQKQLMLAYHWSAPCGKISEFSYSLAELHVKPQISISDVGLPCNVVTIRMTKTM